MRLIWSERNCSGVCWCRAIGLFIRVGRVADERDSNGDERILTERGHGSLLAGASCIGCAVEFAILIDNRRKWVPTGASIKSVQRSRFLFDSRLTAAPRPGQAQRSCDGTYAVVLRLLSEPCEQGVPTVAHQQPLADLLQAIRVSDPF